MLPIVHRMYVCVLVELAFTYQTILALSAELTKVHTGCHLPIYIPFLLGLCHLPSKNNMWNKWKNHFSEMKRDVGMSHHEKEGNKKMPIPIQEIIDNPIPTSLFSIKLSVHIHMCSYFSSNCTPSTHTQQNSCIVHKQRCRDGVINYLLSRYRHLLVPFFFMMRHPYIPLHFKEMIFPLGEIQGALYVRVCLSCKTLYRSSVVEVTK